MWKATHDTRSTNVPHSPLVSIRGLKLSRSTLKTKLSNSSRDMRAKGSLTTFCIRGFDKWHLAKSANRAKVVNHHRNNLSKLEKRSQQPSARRKPTIFSSNVRTVV